MPGPFSHLNPNPAWPFWVERPPVGVPPGTQQLRPDADIVVAGWTPTGAATVWQTISDASDSTFSTATLA